MKLDISSVKNICGDSDQIMVFGISACKYGLVRAALKKLGYMVWNYENTPFNLICFDSKNLFKDDCKAVITTLILENNRRIKNGEPIIPLVFCVGYEADDKTFVLDVEKIASSHAINDSHTSDSELRRCYKIACEMGDEIKKIAELTFKFVKVKQDRHNKEYFYLEEDTPFWKEEIWHNAWLTRKNQSQTRENKQYPWRETLNTFFKTNAIPPTNELERAWKRKLR